MFTIDINTDGYELRATLIYTDAKSKFKFSPEDNERIMEFNLETDSWFDVVPRHGECLFYWDDDYISFEMVNGVGSCGSCSFSVPNTPEVIKSLKDCLAIWKEAVEKS